MNAPAAQHSRNKFVNEFCANAADPKCNCKNNYKEICKPRWEEEAGTDHAFFQKGQKGSWVRIAYEAHHILCAASVGGLLVTADGKGKFDFVATTVWCLNTEDNMIALPKWGHTVKWYCDLKAKTPKSGNDLPKEPPFANLPQHDWDHTGKQAYQSEIDKALGKIVKDLTAANHQAAPQDLANALTTLSKKYKAILKQRGARPVSAGGKAGSGTHDGWMSGRDFPQSDWYLPFSMASKSCVSGKGYPRLDFNAEFKNKLKFLLRYIAPK
jgi:hypothetical protein